MPASTTLQPSQGLNHVTPSLGGNATALLALQKNAEALLKHIESNPNAISSEQYAGQTGHVTKLLKNVIRVAPETAGLLSRSVNLWNTIGAQPPQSSAFALVDGDGNLDDGDFGRPSTQDVLRIFNGTKVINDLSTKLNARVLEATPPPPEVIKDLKAKLQAATKDAQIAEKTLAQVTGEGTKGLDDSKIKAAEIHCQLALLDQAEAYQNLISAELYCSANSSNDLNTVFLGVANIAGWVSGAVNAVRTGVEVVKAVGKVLAK